MRQPNNKKGPEGMAKVNKDVVKRLHRIRRGLPCRYR